MSKSKVYITTAIIAIIIATSTTLTFTNVAVFATPLFGPEGNDTTTDTTTTTAPETAGQQQEQQQTIHITKDSSNSYTISGEMSSVGTFDTTYRIAGERSAMRSAENLIISTIVDDFSSSPTIGYVLAVNATTNGAAADPASGNATTLLNPFATPEQITERITSELRRAITEAAQESNNTTTLPPEQSPPPHVVEIKCDFGMILDEMQCSHHVPSISVGAIEEVAFPTTVNNQITDLVPE